MSKQKQISELNVAEQFIPATLDKTGIEWLNALQQPAALSFQLTKPLATEIRLVRLDEINDEKHLAFRHALANVYASISVSENVRLIYILNGTSEGIALYLGVASDTKQGDVHESIKNLRGALDGQLPGINFGSELSREEHKALLEQFDDESQHGLLLGLPTLSEEASNPEEHNFQGVDRLIRTLQSSHRAENQSTSHWRLTIVSQPLSRGVTQQLIGDVMAISTRLAGLVRTSVQASRNTSLQDNISRGDSIASGTNESRTKTFGKNEGGTKGTNWGDSSSTGTNSSSSSSSNSKNSGESQTKTYGTSSSDSQVNGKSETLTQTKNISVADTKGSTFGITHEISNKQAQHLLDAIEKQLLIRLQKGHAKGLFQTAIYLSADTQSTYQRLKNSVCATFQGNEITISPLKVIDLPEAKSDQFLILPNSGALVRTESQLLQSLYQDSRMQVGTLLTTDELSTVASLPHHEVQGIRRRKTVSFIVDLPDGNQSDAVAIGDIVDRGRRFPNNPIKLSRRDLNKHVFVTGVTGAGKTTTCLKLLTESGLPFMVIEPAKTEYRALAGWRWPDDQKMIYFRPNGDIHQSLRINPFALTRKGQNIKSHAGFLKNVFSAVFPMEASMPAMVEAAILRSYEEKGWDIDETEFQMTGDPMAALTRAWPTMSDMIRQLDILIPTYGLGKEFEEKYRGSLVSRLRSMTEGTLGRVLDVPQSIDFYDLLNRRVVVELEELQSGDDKALMMAFLLGCINEAIRDKYANDPSFRHLTLIEEAHRLLSRPEAGDKAAAMAVEAFADMLAEVRKYGEGLIIADQIPAKLIPDVIKNTHTKIVHRLFAEDDRRAMGEAMMMTEDQRNFLPNLGTGEAIVFCGGWHGAAHAAIRADAAQTDVQSHTIFDINQYGCIQLWQNRKRYYPEFCKLDWLTCDNDSPERFSVFVRETRQAQNYFIRFLQLNSTGAAVSEQKQGYFQKLIVWLKRWQAIAVAEPCEFVSTNNTKDSAVDILSSAWATLLIDSNPIFHSSVDMKNCETLANSNASAREFMTESTNMLFESLTECDSCVKWQEYVGAARFRDLKAHFKNDLMKIKRI